MSKTSNAEERQARIDEARKLYEQSRMTYSELSDLTGINKKTIAAWFLTKNAKAPLPCVIKHIRMCLEEYCHVNQNGGDVIRHLGNEQLAEFLTEFCTAILNSEGNEEKIAPEYRDVKGLVEGTELLKKIIITEAPAHSSVDSQDPCDTVIEIFNNSGLTKIEFSKALDIPLGTVLHWLLKESVPNKHTIRYIQMVFPSEKTCGDVIRHMKNEEIIRLLTDIYSHAIKANGKIENLPPKYRSFFEFVESEQTEQVKPRLSIL